ncbi:MAG: adenine deaminase, partial [Bacillota bacterium]|nr:adenine deaminase [Bacillota bacterium]
MDGDIAIADGYIAGIGEFTGETIIDAKGCVVAPAFIDGHVHIESSMVIPPEFAKVLLLHGVTTAITDPHEIANVLGTNGIQFMLDTAENLLVDLYTMLPSCVPATRYEHSGATLSMVDLKPFYQHPTVLGLAEVMNFPAVLHCESSMIEKIFETKRSGKKMDGHAAGLSSDDLNIYMAAGIRTDHESVTAKEAKERLKKGMYLMIREGTVAKDLRQLLPVVNERNSRRCLFVTDDKHLDDLIIEGSIDHNVRLAITEGLAPITAYQMGTLNAAECFGLTEKGAIAPGYKADLLILSDFESVTISKVFKNGKLVMENDCLVDEPVNNTFISEQLTNTVHFHNLSQEDFHIYFKNSKANIIEIIPNSLLTRHIVEEIEVSENNLFKPSIEKDQLKLAVIERHHMTKHIGLSIVKGLGLKSGAIATTVAHDSHNLILAGTNDADLLFAAEEMRKIQGGLIVVQNGKVLASLPLPIAGLLSDQPYQKVCSSLVSIHHALNKIGASHDFNPFLTLSFLALPVIPELKLTDMGLFQVSSFKHIPIEY